MPERWSYIPTPPGAIRIGPILAVPTVLKEHGIRPDLAFARAGVDGELFRDPESRLSGEAAGRLLQICADLTRCPYFGLLVGERFSLAAFGAIGALMRYLHLHDRAASPVLLAPDKSSILLGYSVFRQDLPGTDQIYDVAIAIAYKILRELCGPAFAPRHVQLAHGRPDNIAPYARVFRCDVVFDADLSGVVVDASWLARPIEGADAELLKRLEKEMNRIRPPALLT